VDKELLKELICKEYPNLIRHLRVLEVEADDLEDVADEVIEKALKYYRNLREPEKIGAWIKTIADNTAKRYFRKKNRRDKLRVDLNTEFGEIDIEDILVEEVTTEKIIVEAEARELVETLLDTLSADGRRIVRMRFWGEYKFREMADILNLNENTVKSIYFRSLKKLKEAYLRISGEEIRYGR